MTLTTEQLLHDRATRGEPLTPAEQAQLEAWYDALNRQEAQVVFGQPDPSASITMAQKNLDLLRTQVDESLTHLALTTQRLQEVSAQNKLLRSEITALREQLAQRNVREAA